MSAETGNENTNTRRAVERYLREGLAVIPVPAGAKNPNRVGWQNERHSVENVPEQWNNGQGIGVLWGAPSGGLVDVDIDWPEARIAARRILPATSTFGRPGAPESHRVYRTANSIPKTKRYKIRGDGDDRSVVEVLSTGTQSLVPPSIHASGERRVWHQDRTAAEIDSAALMKGVADAATAALIARNWPGQGARHDYALAATGYIGRHLPRERAERIMEAAIAASDDEEVKGRLTDVRSTLDNLASGAAVTGGPTLDGLVPGLIDQLRRWHGWGTGRGAEHAIRPERAVSPFRLTDLGNAERLIARHGTDIRYCHTWAKWFAFDGKRWAADNSGEVERRAVETVASIYLEAASAEDSNERKAIAHHAERSESRGRIEAMIALARSRPGIPVAPDDLDADPWLFNIENGTIDLRTGELRDHRRKDLITKIAPVVYDPTAKAPRFLQFLREVFEGDEELISFVRRFAGYSLTGSTEERIFAILHGRGKNGKTTLVELLEHAMGDYATTTDTETILAKRYQGVGNDVAALKGARFVATAEVERGRALAESKVKSLTGNDTVTARFLYAEPFSFRPEFKLWLSTNNKPVIRGTDDAIWDRIRLIPFAKRFEGAEADPRLPEKLRAETPGVLAWMVQGCAEWRRGGLSEPEKVAAATTGYRAEMDALAAFIDEECIVRPEAWCKFADLYTSYTRWCEESNEQPEKKRRFADSLTERGFESDNGAKNVAIRRGIALRYDADPDPSRVNDSPTKPGPEPSDPASGEGGGVNPSVSRLTTGDTQKSWFCRISNEGVNEGYPKSDDLELIPRGGGVLGNTLTIVNSLTQEGDEAGAVTPRDSTRRRLTDEEVERVKRLRAEGMSPKWARKTVLAGGHPLDCECEVCA